MLVTCLIRRANHRPQVSHNALAPVSQDRAPGLGLVARRGGSSAADDGFPDIIICSASARACWLTRPPVRSSSFRGSLICLLITHAGERRAHASAGGAGRCGADQR